MLRGITAERLVVLFMLGCGLLNFPLLALWDQPISIGGIPLFPAGLFLVWLGLIAALAGLMEGREH